MRAFLYVLFASSPAFKAGHPDHGRQKPSRFYRLPHQTMQRLFRSIGRRNPGRPVRHCHRPGLPQPPHSPICKAPSLSSLALRLQKVEARVHRDRFNPSGPEVVAVYGSRRPLLFLRPMTAGCCHPERPQKMILPGVAVSLHADRLDGRSDRVTSRRISVLCARSIGQEHPGHSGTAPVEASGSARNRARIVSESRPPVKLAGTDKPSRMAESKLR